VAATAGNVTIPTLGVPVKIGAVFDGIFYFLLKNLINYGINIPYDAASALPYIDPEVTSTLF
jgi:hypothetical protein